MPSIKETDLKRLISALNFPNNLQDKPSVNQRHTGALAVKIDGIISSIYHDPVLKAEFLKAKAAIDKQEPIPQSVLDVLTNSPTIARPITEVSNELNPYFNWRSDVTPTFAIPTLEVDFSDMPHLLEAQRREIAAICMQQYIQAMKMLEHSVSEVALTYVRENPDKQVFVDKSPKEGVARPTADGVLLRFANVYAQRYLDLMQGYIDWEIQNDIPMIPVHAGQMKVHGFTSVDIIKMQDSCREFIKLADTMERILNLDTVKMDKILLIMTGLDKGFSPDKFVNDQAAAKTYLNNMGINLSDTDYVEICQLFTAYSKLSEKAMLDKAFFLMRDFGHLEPQQIRQQLFYVATMDVKHNKSKDERLLMEIRHRVGGDMSIHQNSPGTLGGNPLAYLQVLLHGEPDNPEAEYRNKMYFVYMCNHFSNAVMRDEATVAHINHWLQSNNKEWRIDPEFVEAMLSRGAQYLPPIFRYGAYANLNRQLRDFRTHQEIEQFYEHNQNISLQEALERVANLNAYYNQPLTARELFNQIGEWRLDSENNNKLWQPLNFGTGAALFNLKDTELPDMSPEARAYVRQVQALKLPVYAGISGTLDQSTAMAGLVGLGTSLDPDVRRRELEVIRLAYLAFMLPGRDHSIHEIMQSSATYGLDYVPGPECVRFVYPEDNQRIVAQLEQKQIERGTHLPSYFFSKEYVKEVAQNIDNEKRRLQDAANAKSLADSRKQSTTVHKMNYYIGVPIAGSLLSHAIAQRLDPSYGITPVPDQNLHMTIGWIEEELTPAQMTEISEKINQIIRKYDFLEVQMDGIAFWGQGKDLILLIKERNLQIDEMRKEIKQYVDSKGFTFNFEPKLHVKIGYCEEPLSDQEAKASFNFKDKKEQFILQNINMMHTNPWNWKAQSDRQFNLHASKPRADVVGGLHKRKAAKGAAHQEHAENQRPQRKPR